MALSVACLFAFSFACINRSLHRWLHEVLACDPPRPPVECGPWWVPLNVAPSVACLFAGFLLVEIDLSIGGSIGCSPVIPPRPPVECGPWWLPLNVAPSVACLFARFFACRNRSIHRWLHRLLACDPPSPPCGTWSLVGTSQRGSIGCLPVCLIFACRNRSIHRWLHRLLACDRPRPPVDCGPWWGSCG